MGHMGAVRWRGVKLICFAVDQLSMELKVFAVDGISGCEAMLRHLQPVQFNLPAWKKERPWVLVENAAFTKVQIGDWLSGICYSSHLEFINLIPSHQAICGHTGWVAW